MELSNFLSLLAQGLLVIGLGVLIPLAFQYVRTLSHQLESKLTADQQQTIDRAVGVAVKAAEQIGGIDGLIGPQKKQQAIQIAQSFLAERGIKLDVGKLVNLIEAEVQTQFSKPTPVVDTAQSRQALVDSAIQAGILAAQQSGLTGLIQNVGEQKKAYAIQMTNQYLGQYGIKVDDQLLNGLIESQLMRFNVTGQPLPASGASAGAPAPVTYPPSTPTGVEPGG
jgi:hypothetical protein